MLSFNDFKDNRYLTIKQVKDLWGYIKKWSKWTKIFYFQINEKEDKEEWLLKFPIIRYYTVFNVEQTSWIKLKINKTSKNESSKLYKAQQIILNYKDKPNIQIWNKASYNLISDIITMPSLQNFKSNAWYFSTLFHEFIHSTWNQKRLSRLWINKIEWYWSETYSKEELVAELWAMFLSMEAWIIDRTLENSKNYIAWWLNYIKWNKKDVIIASIQAEKAVNYILDRNTAE